MLSLLQFQLSVEDEGHEQMMLPASLRKPIPACLEAFAPSLGSVHWSAVSPVESTLPQYLFGVLGSRSMNQ